MKFNHKHEKTTHLPINGQIVQVASLPEELRNEIETLDRFLQDKIECLLELEKLELAAILKTSQIQQQVIAWLNKDKTTDNPPADVTDKEAKNEKAGSKKR